MLRDIVEALGKVPVYSLDIEATSEKPLEARILGVSFSEGERAWWVPTEGGMEELKRAMAPIWEDPGKILVGHNLKYDLQCLELAGVKVRNKLADTMVGLWLLDSTRAGSKRLGLKEAVEEIFGHKMVRFEETEFLLPMFGVDLGEYAKEDAKWTFRLWKRVEEELGKKGLTKCFWDLSMPMVPVVVEMERAGIRVDREYLKTKEKELEGELLRISEAVQKLVKRNVLLSSSDQVRDLLFEELKLPKEKATKVGKSGKVSVDYETLLGYKGQHEVVDLILEHRDVQKLLTTYVRPLLAFSGKYGDWRVHTEFWTCGTDLGRWSSGGGINLQNQPRKGGIKEAFIAEEGYKILCSDFSQLELRMAAHLSGDEEMVKAYREGKDIHQMTAEACGCDRFVGKTFNFALIYGASAQRLKQVLWVEGGRSVELEQVQEWQDRFWKKYRGLRGWHQRVRDQVRRGDTIVKTITGRYRDVKVLKSRFEGDEGARFRVAVHFQVSGSSADLMAISLRNIYRAVEDRRERDKRWREIRPLVQVHDELVMEVPEELTEEVQALVKQKMENAVKLKVPIVADVGVGRSWAEAKGK